MKFTKFFNKEILPLKKDWNELYLYLKNGHLLKENGNENYIYSYSLYLLLKRNSLKIYNTEYLNNFNSFVKAFGKPRYKWVKDGKVFISYFQTVVGDPCHTCHHSGFGYTFDEETKKLLME
ncbi:hypothetical protein CEQ90_20555 [Lewinellaceae bacterium SD302]|nr:hypothetical protein CEQ90_20555 [Lewinellaceae bacterium SD302]